VIEYHERYENAWEYDTSREIVELKKHVAREDTMDLRGKVVWARSKVLKFTVVQDRGERNATGC
jgi:hypothetical protein